MKRYTMIALTNAKPGRETEFIEWYRNVHLAEVLSVPGVVTAQLGTVVDIPAAGKPPYGYTGIYTIEADDPAAVFEEMMRRYVAGEMSACDAMDPASYNNVFACDPMIAKD